MGCQFRGRRKRGSFDRPVRTLEMLPLVTPRLAARWWFSQKRVCLAAFLRPVLTRDWFRFLGGVQPQGRWAVRVDVRHHCTFSRTRTRFLQILHRPLPPSYTMQSCYCSRDADARKCPVYVRAVLFQGALRCTNAIHHRPARERTFRRFCLVEAHSTKPPGFWLVWARIVGVS